jgi:DNA anti-recombination protein RmuC
MSELRTEVKTIRHNEALAERSEVIGLQKELDSLNQETKESLENLRNDVTIEMNNRKIASRAEQQGMEVKIQDLNYGFTKRLADMRTEAEAQKWQTTRLLIGTIPGVVFGLTGV